MAHSMTGFARAEQKQGTGMLSCEIRGVNHRHLELGVRLPEEFRSLEPRVRERLASTIRRGKVECTLRMEVLVGGESLVCDEMRLQALLSAAAALPAGTPPLRAIDLLRWPGVLVATTGSPVAPEGVLGCVEEAVQRFQEHRRREGENLVATLVLRLDALEQSLGQVRALVPVLVPEFQARLMERLKEVAGTLDPTRVEQEMVLFAQRSDIAEELDRLAAHVAEVRHLLSTGEPLGRRLDFMMQEFNREANTIASKSSDLRLTRLAVELKVLIEQMREQIQNLE